MRQWVLNKLLTIIMASFSAGIAAETLSVPQNGQIKKTIGEQTLESNLSLPQRGLSKEQVLESLGEPAAKQAAVGTPPISICNYPEFKVYFENDLVLYAVVKRPAKLLD